MRDLPTLAARALAHAFSLVTGSYRKTIGALALIRDADGNILLARTTYPPRVWNLPGGRVERHESPEQALVREVREETGFGVEIDALLLVDVSLRHSVTFTFACSITGGEARPFAGEISALRWATPREIERLPWRQRQTIRRATQAGPAPHYWR